MAFRTRVQQTIYCAQKIIKLIDHADPPLRTAMPPIRHSADKAPNVIDINSFILDLRELQITEIKRLTVEVQRHCRF